MKKFFLSCLAAISVCGITMTAAPIASAAALQSDQAQQQEQSQWIEIGEVTMKLYRVGTYKTYNKKAILYVMHLGERFIYRIKFNDKYYSVSPLEEDWGYNKKTNAYAKIPEGGAYFDVPQW